MQLKNTDQPYKKIVAAYLKFFLYTHTYIHIFINSIIVKTLLQENMSVQKVIKKFNYRSCE